MKIFLFTIFALITLQACERREEEDLLLSLKINSEEVTWKETQFKLEKKYGYQRSQTIKKYFNLGDDSVLVEYVINDPLRFGKLRVVKINILRGLGKDSDCNEMAGGYHLAPYFETNTLQKSTVSKIISFLTEIYGKPDSVTEFVDYQKGATIDQIKRKLIIWKNYEYTTGFYYGPFFSNPCYKDSVSVGSNIEIKSNNYEGTYIEDLNLFKSKYKTSDIVEITLQPPRFVEQKNPYRTNFTLVENYVEFDHNDLGYNQNIESVKFDVIYKNKFDEVVLVVKDINYDFPDSVKPGIGIILTAHSSGITGFRKQLTSEEVTKCWKHINDPHNWLRPTISNLKLRYTTGEIF